MQVWFSETQIVIYRLDLIQVKFICHYYFGQRDYLFQSCVLFAVMRKLVLNKINCIGLRG